MRALGIIDCQNDFFKEDGALPVPGALDIRNEIRVAIKVARTLKMPIFFTADDHIGTEPELAINGGPFPPHCMHGTEGQKNIDEAPVLGSPYFTKRCPDVFDKDLGNHGIKNWLTQNGITGVALIGVVGNICVEAAALGIREMGIEVSIIEDAVVWMDIDEDNNEEKSRQRLTEAGVTFI